MRPAILFLGTQMAVGGAQRMMLLQSGWFHQHGYPTFAIFFYDKEGLQEKWQSENEYPIKQLGGWKFGATPFTNAFRLLRALWRLWRFFQMNDIFVIETFTPHSDLWGLPIAWLARVPVRIGCYQGIIQTMPGWQAWIHARLMNTAIVTNYVGVSNQMVEGAVKAGIRPEKIVMIPNAINIPSPEAESEWRGKRDIYRQEIGVSNGDVLTITSARLDREKGHTYLLQAIPQVLKAFPDTVFAFAGDGYLRSELEQEAARLGIKDNVRFLGIRHDIPALLRASDIYILPSLAEGLSLAMLEAMVAGLPILVTQVQGATDVVGSGENGILVSPEDPDALAEALFLLLEHPETWQSLGAAARQTILESYTIDRIARKYEKLFLSEHGSELI